MATSFLKRWKSIKRYEVRLIHNIDAICQIHGLNAFQPNIFGWVEADFDWARFAILR